MLRSATLRLLLFALATPQALGTPFARPRPRPVPQDGSLTTESADSTTVLSVTAVVSPLPLDSELASLESAEGFSLNPADLDNPPTEGSEDTFTEGFDDPVTDGFDETLTDVRTSFPPFGVDLTGF